MDRDAVALLTNRRPDAGLGNYDDRLDAGLLAERVDQIQGRAGHPAADPVAVNRIRADDRDSHEATLAGLPADCSTASSWKRHETAATKRTHSRLID
jgi:hypothetical protein